jgi:hypothetical protein
MPVQSGPERTGQLENRRLTRCVTRSALLDLCDHSIEIGIAGAKLLREPVPPADGNSLTVSNDLKLSGLARRSDDFDSEALLDEGHETRDLGVVVLSRGAVYDLNLHLVPPSVSRSDGPGCSSSHGDCSLGF